MLAKIAHDVVAGLAFLHRQAYVHLDVKPANVLLGHNASGVAKLADFGVARHIEADRNYRLVFPLFSPLFEFRNTN